MYHVFRRHPDGYVNGVAGDVERLTGRGRLGTLNGEPVTFEVLLSTDNWDEAKDRIVQERNSYEDMRAEDLTIR